MKIYMFGQRNILGGGVHYSGFLDAMAQLSGLSEVVVEVQSSGKKINPIIHQITENDVSVFFFPSISEHFVRGFVIKWAIFESDVLPDDYLEYLSRSDLIWTPSNWAKKVLISCGLEKNKIHIVNEGVDPSAFHPFLSSCSYDDKPFRFLMCGKKENRKGFNELLQGFKLAFGEDPNTELHLKADYFWGDENAAAIKKSELNSEISDLNLFNVIPIYRAIPKSEMGSFYRGYHALVFPSRAEGWGLPLIEAIACGLPVASTFYSGHTEFLSLIENHFTKIDHELRSINCEEFLEHWNCGGSWAVAKPQEIAKKLIFLKENYEKCKANALFASDTIRNKVTWRHASEQAILSLKSIGIHLCHDTQPTY
jgi:glycosyltransferase involved in cell wall biosynthesis